MAGHEDAGVVTGHIRTNTPEFVPPCWERPRFDPTQTGLCKFGWAWSALKVGQSQNAANDNMLIFFVVFVLGYVGAGGKHQHGG